MAVARAQHVHHATLRALAAALEQLGETRGAKEARRALKRPGRGVELTASEIAALAASVLQTRRESGLKRLVTQLADDMKVAQDFEAERAARLAAAKARVASALGGKL